MATTAAIMLLRLLIILLPMVGVLGTFGSNEGKANNRVPQVTLMGIVLHQRLPNRREEEVPVSLPPRRRTDQVGVFQEEQLALQVLLPHEGRPRHE